MAFIPVPDTAVAKIRGLWEGQKVENTLHFSLPVGSWDEAALTAAAAALGEWWVASVLPNLAAAYVVNSVFMQDLSSEDGLVVEDFSEGGEDGGNAAGGMPNNVSWVLKFVTGLAGRSFKGRNYLPGIPRNQVAGSYISVDWANAVKAAYGLLLTTVEDIGVWTVVSRYHDLAPRVTGVATPINSVGYTDLVLDSRRRRLPGRGE